MSPVSVRGVVNLFKFTKDQPGFLYGLLQSKGEFARFSLGDHGCILISDPSAAREILSDSTRFPKPDDLHTLRLAIGNGLLFCRDDEHAEQKEAIAHLFSASRMNDFLPVLGAHVDSFVGELVLDRDVYDAYERFSHLALSVIVLLLEIKIDADRMNELLAAVAGLEERICEVRKREMHPILPSFSEPDAVLTETRDRILRILRMAMEELPEGSRLSNLAQSHGMEFLENQLCTLAIAGFETTALTLTWTVYLLALHPQIQKRLKEELRQDVVQPSRVFSPRPTGSLLDAVIFESMRLCPVVHLTSRQSSGDCEILGEKISKDESILISPYAMHRHRKYFDRPNDYDPSRWLGTKATELERNMVTFGYGSRSCIGQTLAMAEIRLCIASLFSRDIFVVPMTKGISFDPGITLKPRKPIHLKNDLEGAHP